MLSTDSMSHFKFFLDVKTSSNVNRNRLSSLSLRLLLLCSIISTFIGINMTIDAVRFREMINNATKQSSITFINEGKATSSANKKNHAYRIKGIVC